MAATRVINTNFWKDNYVMDLDPSEKLLFLYFLTNPNTTIAGIYEINLRQVAFDTGYDKDMVIKILDRFVRDGKMWYRDGWLILTNFIKHQALNPKVRTGIERVIGDLPVWLQPHVKVEQIGSQMNLFIDTASLDNDSLSKPIDSVSHLTKLNLTKLNLTKLNADDQQSRSPAKKRIDRIPTETISSMLDYWDEMVGYPVQNEDANRKAIATLIRSLGIDQVKILVRTASAAQADQYAPKVSDYVKLKYKLNDLIAWGRSKNIKQSKKVGVVR